MDNIVNAIKPAPKRNYEDAYSKVLQGCYPAHPDLAIQWEIAGV
jgi:hypothetical protein